MRITVFTPTYNRGYIISNLYKSLQRQGFSDFEWIVVDDGSTDNTEILFSEFIKDENNFKITYVKTENGGKHRAINKGIEIANGELFFIVDSDDYLTDDALQKIDFVERTLSTESGKFGGICGSKGFSEKEIVGSTYENEGFLDITTLERPKYKINGDKAEVFYTDVLKNYLFPEFEGEKFLTEGVVWDRIANDGYKLRFFNDIIYICDYLPDGLTAGVNKNIHNSPKGYGLWLYQEYLFGKRTGLSRWNSYLDYYYEFKKELSWYQISKNLHMNCIEFFVRINFLRLFYKIYSK